MKVGNVLEVMRHVIYAASPPCFSYFKTNSVLFLNFFKNSRHKINVIGISISSEFGSWYLVFFFSLVNHKDNIILCYICVAAIHLYLFIDKNLPLFYGSTYFLVHIKAISLDDFELRCQKLHLILAWKIEQLLPHIKKTSTGRVGSLVWVILVWIYHQRFRFFLSFFLRHLWSFGLVIRIVPLRQLQQKLRQCVFYLWCLFRVRGMR